MIMPTDKNYWFRAKRYGYGWGLPVRWEGWVVLMAWLAVLVFSGLRFMPQRPGLFWGAFLVATAVLALVCYLKGEPTRWRWGEKSDGQG